MVETFTSTTRVTSVGAEWSLGLNTWGEIAVIDVDEKRHTVGLSETSGPWGPAADGSTLDAIRDNYADGGFTDADGDAVTITLIGVPGGITNVALLEDAGIVNPFDDGSFDRLRTAKSVNADNRHVTRTKDATSGHVQHDVPFSAIPVRSSPASTSMTYRLHGGQDDETALRFDAFYYRDQDWVITHPFSVEEDDFTLSDIGPTGKIQQSVYWKTMIAMLQGLKSQGADVPATLDFTASGYDADDPLPGRVFQVDFYHYQQGATQVKNFSVVGLNFHVGDPDNPNHVTSMNWVLRIPSGQTNPSVSDWQNYLRNTDVTVVSQPNTIVPRRSSLTIPLYGSELSLPDDVAVVPWRGVAAQRDVTGVTPFIGGFGKEVDVNDLPVHADGKKLLWLRADVTEVNIGGSDNHEIRFRDPADLDVPIGRQKRLEINNTGSGLTKLYKWDGSLVCYLSPNQSSEWALIHRADGTTHLRVVRLPPRRFESTYHADWTMDEAGIEWTDNTLVPLRQRYRDPEAFTVGTLTAYTDLQAVNFTHALKVTMPGILSIEVDGEFEIDGGGSTYLSLGWQHRIWHKKGAADAVVAFTHGNTYWSGEGDPAPFDFVHILETVAKNDITFTTISRGSLQPEHMEIRSLLIKYGLNPVGQLL